MHVRVRMLGQPESIVVVESKLTKIEQFRRLIRDKFDVQPKLQRLFYGGKLLEDGCTFHDYNIKLNDVIQLMVRLQPVVEHHSDNEELKTKSVDKADVVDSISDNAYEDVASLFYAVGDLVDMRDREHGAWFEGCIVRIVKDLKHKVDNSEISTKVNSDLEDRENKPPSEPSSSKASKTSPGKAKGIADYFSRTPKNGKQTTDNKNKGTSNTEVGLLYKIHLDAEEEEKTDYYCQLQEIRPRARTVISVDNLKVGQKVMINHNLEDHLEKGYWYDFKIDEIKKLRKSHELIGTLYLGPDAIPQNDTKARVLDKIYAIEELVPLADRTEDYKELMRTAPEKRSSPLNCLTCRDDEDQPCKDCGCFQCSGKENPEKIILCDECNHGYHMHCLSPPLTALPDEDWYCPGCKRDTSGVVAPGAAKQARKNNTAKGQRDWGRGMACAGKTKTSAMPANHFGPIPGIEVGMCWRFRIQLSESGVHRPPVSGIHGRDVEGAYSIVLSGGYEDDYDNGYEFTYTGSGGRDLSGNKRTAEQSCDQTLTRENKALARNCAVKVISEKGGDAGDAWRDGRPVRVVRSYKMIKHFPEYAPKQGIRYDGIYKVVKYYPEQGKSGFRVWKYLLRRDDPSPAPWEPNAKQYSIVYPDGYLEAEALKKAAKETGVKPKSNKGKGAKRTLRESNRSSGSEGETPPSKRAKKQEETKKRDRPSKNKSLSQSPKGKLPSLFAATKKEPEVKPTEDSEQMLSKTESEAIAEDSLNKKLWDECLDILKNGTKKEFVEHVTEVFLCIICQDVAANPVTTPCLHNFCLGCLKLAFKSTGGQTCPCCRGELPPIPRPNVALQTALRAVMPGYDAGRK